MPQNAIKSGMVTEGSSAIEDILKLGYQKVRVLGAGTYGTVWKCLRKEDQRFVAVKHMKFDAQEDGIPSTALREITILKELNHPNIVRLLNIVYSNEKLFLVLEHCSKDLKKLYSLKRQPFHAMLVKSFAFQLLKGIDFCHSNRVLHRDLKPQNILINADGILKLADFGLSRAVQILPAKRLTREVITLWYRAPEILLGARSYDASVDIWSAGLIIGEMIKGAPLAAGDSEVDQLFKIFRIFGTPTEGNCPGVTSLPHFQSIFPKFPPTDLSSSLPPLAPTKAIDLLDNLIQYDPKSRVCAQDCLKHPYFRGIQTKLRDGSMEKIFCSEYKL